MSAKQNIQSAKPWLLAAAVVGLAISPPWESGAANARKECIAECKALKKDCISSFRLHLTEAKAVCNTISGKAGRKQCRRDLKPEKEAFKIAKQECKREFKSNCKQCCKEHPTEDCQDTSFIVCGDGNRSGGEECDDGNRKDGDACSRICRLEARCGDGAVDPGEECEGDSGCPEREKCVACSCRPECENDDACADTEDCVAGGCVPRLGTRRFSLGEHSTLWSSFLPTFPLGTSAGSIEFEAGAPDENGAAEVTAPTDRGPYFMTIDIAVLSQQLTVCSKVVSCEGTIYCRGGANVDVEVELDSLAEGLACEHGNQCTGTSMPCCSNACEGATTEGPYAPQNPQNPWTPITSGNAPLNRIGFDAGDSLPGAMVLACQVAALDVPLGTDCTTATYGNTQEMLLTTGENTARVVNHCPGIGAPPVTVPEFSKRGANFDCKDWGTEDGEGALAFSIPIEEPSNLVTGDGAQAGIYDD